MDDMKIKLAVIWIALMLTYLLGDVLRLFAGDFVPGEIMGKQMPSNVYLGIAVFMWLPILMVILTVMLDQPLNRLLNIGMAILFFLFNAVGVASYKSAYDVFLIIVGLGINILTILLAWQWH